MKPDSMLAMQIVALGNVDPDRGPLVQARTAVPVAGRGEVLLKVLACGVCRTELDEIEGRTAPSALPRTPGHQVVGRVVAAGDDVDVALHGKRVGVAWIFSACGTCEWCRRGEENLCPGFMGTGRDRDGGYAEYMRAPAAFMVEIPASLGDEAAAPLLCAGAVGWRSLKLAGVEDGEVLGLTGFGAANHLVLKLARAVLPASPVMVRARSPRERELALRLGASWAGDTHDTPPRAPRAIIDTTPVWATVLAALEWLAPGGRLVINAIRKEDTDRRRLADLDYARHLWLEKEIRSVANVTREDVREVLALAARHGIVPEFQRYRLADANRALGDLKAGRIQGAKVLCTDGEHEPSSLSSGR